MENGDPKNKKPRPNDDRAEAMFTNQDGVIVVQAFLSGIIPGAPERDILNQMLAEGDPTNLAG